MSSVTNPEFGMVSPSTKKRRREDGNGVVQIPFSTYEASQNPFSNINHNDRLYIPSNRGSPPPFTVPRKCIPITMSKRIRRVEDDYNDQPSNRHLHSHPHHNTTQSPTLFQTQQSHFSHAHPDLTPDTSTSVSSHQFRPLPKSSHSSLLSPCHICHRKPYQKSDLDSFADCAGCGQRACFVCLRACQGWPPVSGPDPDDKREENDLSSSFTMHDVDNGADAHSSQADRPASKTKPEHKHHKKGLEGGGKQSWIGQGHCGVICSRCCVERGSEGDVVCLGCLAGMEGA